MKKFRHKKIWWIAQESWCNYYYRNDKNFIQFIDKKLLLEWEDREEVTRDWLDDLMSDLKELKWNFAWCENEFRRVVEKNIPKQKKFTRDEIIERKERTWVSSIAYICTFLEQNDLLLDDK